MTRDTAGTPGGRPNRSGGAPLKPNGFGRPAARVRLLCLALCCALALHPTLLTPWVGGARAAARTRAARGAESSLTTLAAGAMLAATNAVAGGIRRLIPSREEARRASASAGAAFEPAAAIVFLGAPAGLSVVSASDSQIVLSWPSVAGAVSYRVERSPNVLSPYVNVGTPAANGFEDNGVSRGNAYLYRVRAVDTAGALSPPSPVTMATAVTFSDEPLVTGVTRVRAVHVEDLRTAIDAVRRVAARSNATWGQAVATEAIIRAAQVQELRDRLDEGLSALGLPTDPYTDATLSTGANGTPIRKVHFEELRTRSTRGSGVTGSSLTAYDFATARLDPSNRTGSGGLDLLSRNFNWSLPLVSLPGRAGLDLGLSLSYNSQVWTKSGNYVLFDGDWGWPAPGFRLGFPLVQGKFNDAQAQKSAYMMLTPSGARVSLRQTATPTVYESGDSSYLQLTENADGTLTLRAQGGARMSFSPLGGVYKCTEVKDRNGNVISAEYNGYGNLETVTDTTGRELSFIYYLDGYLKEITQTWHREVESGNTTQTVTETHRWARFEYDDVAVTTNFTGLTVFGPANGQTFHALSKVKLADESFFTFNYTSWGQARQFASYAPDGRLLNYVSLDLPADASQPQADSPRPTQRRYWAAYWNGDVEGSPAQDGSEEAATLYGPYNFAGGVARVTAPDGTLRKETYETSGWRRGLTTRTDEYSADDLENPKRWTTLVWTQDDENLTYQQNPRVSEARLEDPGHNQNAEQKGRRVEITYTSFGLPEDVKEYDATAATVLRRTHTEYVPGSVSAGGAYFVRRIIGLPLKREVYGRENGQEKLFSKATYEYDLGSEFLVAPGIDPATVTQHDEENFGAGFHTRGNLSRARRWDVTDADNESKSVASEMGYNTLGSVVFTRDALARQTGVSYSDSDGGSRLAYPTTVTLPGGFTASTWYNYDMGLVRKSETPKPNVETDQPGPEVERFYDASGRTLKVKRGTDGSYMRWEYGASGLSKKQLTTIDTGMAETFSLSVTDGAGRVIGVLAERTGAGPAHVAGRSEYDHMGRLARQYNASEVTVDVNDLANVGQWTPAGEDENPQGREGWPYSETEYDWKGRPRREVNADGTDRLTEYDGCGCAGGEVVIVKGELVPAPDASNLARRTRKIYHDVLGRPLKTELLDWEGEVYSTTTNVYNALDQVTESSELVGSSGAARVTTAAYDGHGRMSSRHLPEQNVGTATVYSYNPDDTLDTVKDARNVTTRFTYGARRLLTKVVYDNEAVASVITDKNQATAVANAPWVAYSYDAAGNRKTMTTQDGKGGAVSYVYDELSRLTSETRNFASPGLAGAYTLAYDYTLSGALKTVTDEASDVSFTQTYDKAGLLTGVSGVGYGGAVTQFISGVAYRAWGAPSALAFGNGVGMSFDYNGRGLVTGSALSVKLPWVIDPPNFTRTYGAAYSYYPDGGVKYVQDQLVENGTPTGPSVRDRAYDYDFAGRLTQAITGAQARDFVNGTTGGAADGPYHSTYAYDAWGHTTSVNASYWGRADVTVTNYNAAGRNADWEYDPEGRLISRNEPNDDVLTPYQPLRYAFDAAGREAGATQTTTYSDGNQLHTHVISNTAIYDGDGQPERFVMGHTANGQPAPDSRTTYLLRSSVLGGHVVSEYDAQGAWQGSYVYAGGERVGTQGKLTPAGGVTQAYNTWRHKDPVTGDEVNTDAQGGPLGRTTFDPQGVDAGENDPFPPGGEGDDDGFVEHYNTSPSGAFVAELMPRAESGRTCVQDGIRTDCAFISWSAVQICPDNDCRPRTVYGTLRINGRVVGQNSRLTQAFGSNLSAWERAAFDGTLNETYRATGFDQIAALAGDYSRFFLGESDVPVSAGTMELLGLQAARQRGQTPCEQFLARQFTDDPDATFVDVTDGDGFDPIVGQDRSYVPIGTKPPFTGHLGETHNHLYNGPKDVKKPINIRAPAGGIILDSGYTRLRDSFITVYYEKFGKEKDVVLQLIHPDNFNTNLLDKRTDGLVLGQMGPKGGGAYEYNTVPGQPLGYHVHVNAMKKWWKGTYVRKDTKARKATPKFESKENRKHVSLSTLCTQ